MLSRWVQQKSYSEACFVFFFSTLPVSFKNPTLFQPIHNSFLTVSPLWNMCFRSATVVFEDQWTDGSIRGEDKSTLRFNISCVPLLLLFTFVFLCSFKNSSCCPFVSFHPFSLLIILCIVWIIRDSCVALTLFQHNHFFSYTSKVCHPEQKYFWDVTSVWFLLCLFVCSMLFSPHHLLTINYLLCLFFNRA